MELEKLARELLEYVKYWDGWPTVAVYNEDGINHGEIEEEFYQILKKINDIVGE